jgi:hypothetical protein
MTVRSQLVLILIALSLSIACGSEEKPEDSANESLENDVLPWERTVFTNDAMLSITLGQDLQTFLATYSPSAIEEDVQYSFEGTLQNGLPFSYYVTAENDRIYEMSMDIYPEKNELPVLFNKLRIHFDSLYHKSRPTDGYATWKRASDNGRLVEVTLSDESLEMRIPTIMVNQLEHVDRDYED